MKIVRSILAVVLSALLAAAFLGCAPKPDSGVAATVNGVEVPESDITALMEFYRLNQETGVAMTDAEWATYMQSATVDASWLEFFQTKGYTDQTFTPEMLREYVIRNNFSVFVLMLQKAEEKGITVDPALIDTKIEAVHSSASAEGLTFEQWLHSRGFANEKTYRLMLEAYEVSQPLAETLVMDPTQEEVDEYTRSNISYYAGKRISLIALQVTETELEADVRTKMDAAKAKLDAGTDFATVVTETVDAESGLVETGGDLGWGQEPYMPTEVGAALDALAVNQPSDVIEVREDTAGTTDDPSDDTVTAMYIVMYTDEYILPADTSATEDEGVTDGGATDGSADGTTDGTEGADGTDGTTDGSETPTDEGTTDGSTDGSDDTTDGTTDDGTDASSDGTGTEDSTDDTTEQPYANLDLTTIPQNLRDKMAELAKTKKISDEQETFWTGLAQSDEIIVNPMPEGLSYDVDMSLASTETTPDGSTEEEAPESLTPVDTAEAVAAAEATGLVITEVTEGTGAEAMAGDEVLVYYTGMLSDGTVFDSNVGGSPFAVTIGARGAIPGFEDGIIGLKVGGTRTVTIPPSQGYADVDNGTIPANSILTFEITLTSVNGDTTGYVDAGANSEVSDEEPVVE